MNAKIFWRGHQAAWLTLIIILCGALTAVAGERVVIQPPPGGGDGERIGWRDLEGPYVPGTQPRPDNYWDKLASAALQSRLTRDKNSREDDLGGDDLIISTEDFHRDCSIDIASNGDIYIALCTGDLTGPPRRGIKVFRSQDGGTVWQDWGFFEPTNTTEEYIDPSLHVAEGDVNRCYLAFQFHDTSGFHIQVAHSDLSSSTGSWTTVTAMSTGGISYGSPDITSDAISYSDHFLYLVGRGNDGVGTDIWFTRSVDFGTTFETPYMIAELILDDRGYREPVVEYGIGGYLHVAFYFEHYTDTMDAAIRYRRATSYANGGLASWGAIQYLSPNDDGIWDILPCIAASTFGNEVLLVHSRYLEGNIPQDPGEFCSHDQGVTFPDNLVVSGGLIHPHSIDQNQDTGNWVLGGGGHYPWGPGIQRASVAAPTVWSAREEFVDDNSASGTVWSATTTLDPFRSYQVAAAWVDLHDVDRHLKFDAEWRAGPGYPNLEPGFPVNLDAEPESGPALVDLNKDGDLEIVFADDWGLIQAFQYDGTPLPGWPVSINEAFSDGPVAIGDLRGNGDMLVVAGSANGNVFCFDAQGQVAPGNWPYESGLDSPAFVAIGAFGEGPYTRGIVVSVGNRGLFLDHSGGMYPGAISKTLARNATHAPAIGDVDGDGRQDVVYAHEEVVGVAPVFYSDVVFGDYMSAPLSGSPTLGDFNNDGAYEVVVPLENGTLHVLDEDGNDLPGFPFTSPSGSRLSTAAIGQMLGTWEPEIVFAARNWTVHLLYSTGNEGLWWPNDTDGWANYGSPIIGRVNGSSSDVVLGSRGRKAWAWENLGALIPGWPKTGDDNFYVAPAMGDIDLDGSNEIVLISTSQLLVVDVNVLPNDPSRTWGMAGHDHQRTGCADCPEDLVTPVPDDPGAVTKVSFALPSPNPTSGSATFRFAVPGFAVVNLEVYDVRGHRVSLVTRKEVERGEHVVSWGGLDDRGQALASGLYFARLRVRGPGINEELTRKIMLAK